MACHHHQNLVIMIILVVVGWFLFEFFFFSCIIIPLHVSIQSPLLCKIFFQFPRFRFYLLFNAIQIIFLFFFLSYMIIDVIFSFYSSSSSMSSLESFSLSLIQGVSSVMEGMMWIINNVSCLNCQNEWNTIYRHLCLNMIFIFSTFHAWKYFLPFI